MPTQQELYTVLTNVTKMQEDLLRLFRHMIELERRVEVLESKH